MRRPLAVCDAETDPFDYTAAIRPFVWGYYDGETYRQFPENARNAGEKSTAAFVEFIRTQRVICFAHNGGKFDWHFLLDHLDAYSDVSIINGRISRFFLGDAECRDSYNLIPRPLSAYKKDKIDYTLMLPEKRRKPENWRKIGEYLRSDCIYLYEWVQRFVELFGLHLTMAGASMQQWKRISRKPLPRTDKHFYDEIAPYYYGGRVQCFRKGIIETDFKVFDINSAYPYAMLSEHPYSVDYMRVDGYRKNADFYRLTAKSTGAFPFRGDDGLEFPADGETREFTVSQWEHSAARETGTLQGATVKESITFLERVTFDAYIHRFFDMRLRAKAEKDDVMDLFAKLFMNSLYGKFAANPDNYSNFMIFPMEKLAGIGAAGWSFAGELGPWALASQPLRDEQARYYNLATAASITGYVRAMLWRAICVSKGVLYCDTDSIAVERAGSLALSDALGDWKLEGEFDRAGIGGKKLYIFRGKLDKGKKQRRYKTASKGARLTHAQLWAVARGETVTYTPIAPTYSVHHSPRITPRDLRLT